MADSCSQDVTKKWASRTQTHSTELASQCRHTKMAIYVRISNSTSHHLDRHIQLSHAQTGAVLHRYYHMQINTLGEHYICDFAPHLLHLIRHKARSFRRVPIPPCGTRWGRGSPRRISLKLWQISLHFLLSF